MLVMLPCSQVQIASCGTQHNQRKISLHPAENWNPNINRWIFIDTQESPKHKLEFDLFKLIFLSGVGQNRESTTFQLKAKNSTLKHCHSIQGFDSLNSAH
jgi:hypothetical protein